MKKMVIALICFMLSPLVSVADTDFSSMSYDDLVSLSKQVGIAIMEHDDFDSVSVPMGLWEVGVDIPAGVWILSSTDGSYVSVTYGNTLDSSGNDMNQFDKGNTAANFEDAETWRINAKEGCYFHIEYNSVTFTSDTGTTSLGFKKK